jgi:ATP-dependent Clp protease ATP-binding subunit ClpA
LLEINKVAERLVDHNIVLTATPAALTSLGNEGYDPDMGARPLRRVIQLKVEDQLSDSLLSGAFVDGDHIEVDVNPEGEVILTRMAVPEMPEVAPEPSA